MQYLKLFLLGCTGNPDCLFSSYNKVDRRMEKLCVILYLYCKSKDGRFFPSSNIHNHNLSWGPPLHCVVLTWLKGAILFVYFHLSILSLTWSNIFSDILLLPEHFDGCRPHFLPESIQTPLLCWSICTIHSRISCGRLGISVVINWLCHNWRNRQQPLQPAAAVHIAPVLKSHRFRKQ